MKDKDRNDEWPSCFRSWRQQETLAHPDSPEGGTGPGFSTLPISQSLCWPALLIPSPHSPEALLSDWLSKLSVGPDFVPDDFTLQLRQAERSMEDFFGDIRKALPDSLLSHFDRQNKLVATACEKTSRNAQGVRGGIGAVRFLRRLRIEAHWFDYPGTKSSFIDEAAGLLGEAEATWEYGGINEKRMLIEHLQACAWRLREGTVSNIKKAWADAGRSGKQLELIDAWKHKMRWIEDLVNPGAAKTNEADEAKPSGSGARLTKEKTWVEFRLIDPLGNPIADENYKVILPSGSHRDGSLDAYGTVRFENIDPGLCRICFPNIDARAWHPI